MTDKIKKDTTLGEIAQKYPKAAEILTKNGLPCVGCPMAMLETLEMGARSHGLDVDKLLKQMNKIIEDEQNGKGR
jgi:hybrid cluster-associated redox disulfide protein